MTGWIRFENTTPDNPKVLAVSDRAFRLWFNAIAYCSRARSSGKVPAAVLNQRASSADRRAVRELVAVGLLDRSEGGDFVVHDYLEFNPSRERIEEMRAKNRERQQKFRNGNVTALPTPLLTRDSHARVRSGLKGSSSSHASEEGKTDDARALFDAWRERCGHPQAKATRERLAKIRARLAEGYTSEQILTAIDGAARAAHVSEQGRRFDDIELICRNGAKLESFIARAGSSPALAGASRPEALERADRWRKFYPPQQEGEGA